MPREPQQSTQKPQDRITANAAYYGLCGPPHNPYLEYYSEQNGRVVLELEPEQVEVIGTPIPAVESDPISRAEQEGKMANFLAGMSRELQVPVVLAKPHVAVVSDPEFTHWVVGEGTIVGEARVTPPQC